MRDRRLLAGRPRDGVIPIARDTGRLRVGEVLALQRITIEREEPRAPRLDLVNQLPRAVAEPDLIERVIGEEARDAGAPSQE